MPDKENRIFRQIAAGALAAGAIFGMFWMYRNRRLFLTSDVTSGDSWEYPEIRAHVYFASVAESFAAAKTAVDSAPDVYITQIAPEHATLAAESGEDLVEVHIHPLGKRHARVVIRSRAQSGGPDFGRNANRVRAIQQAMDRALVGG